MKQSTVRRITFLAALLCAGAASAGSEIVKCTGPDGRVTLSDQPCSNGEAQLVLQQAPAAAPAAAPAEVTAPATVVAPAPLPVPQRLRAALPPRQAMPLLRPTPPARYLSQDVATLKNARAALHMLDAAPRMRMQLASNH